MLGIPRYTSEGDAKSRIATAAVPVKHLRLANLGGVILRRLICPLTLLLAEKSYYGWLCDDPQLNRQKGAFMLRRSRFPLLVVCFALVQSYLP
jgi:hypothetical protein